MLFNLDENSGKSDKGFDTEQGIYGLGTKSLEDVLEGFVETGLHCEPRETDLVQKGLFEKGRRKKKWKS